MEIKQVIADWVRLARTEANLSGEQLGVKLALELGTDRGHTRANISHWETQKHEPSLQQILAIIKITGKSLPPTIIAAMQTGVEVQNNVESNSVTDHDTHAVIKMMQGTDQRGRQKIRLAAEDTLDEHNTHLRKTMLVRPNIPMETNNFPSIAQKKEKSE